VRRWRKIADPGDSAWIATITTTNNGRNNSRPNPAATMSNARFKGWVATAVGVTRDCSWKSAVAL